MPSELVPARPHPVTTQKKLPASVTSIGLVPDAVSDVMTLTEAAAFLKCCEKTVLKMAKSRIIPSRRVGTGWRFSRLALTKWMQDENKDDVA